MTVYIVNKSAHNFSEAEKFGEIVFLTSGRLNRFNINDMHRQCTEALSESKEDDYIVPCSLNILNSIACSIFAVKHGRLNLLLFKEGRYKSDKGYKEKDTYLERNIVFIHDPSGFSE